jgi:hypothetical protein
VFKDNQYRNTQTIDTLNHPLTERGKYLSPALPNTAHTKPGLTNTTSSPHLVHQLQSIATQKSHLLRKLDDLQREEIEVLYRLVRLESGMHTTLSLIRQQPLNVALLPRPVEAVSKIPQWKGSKTAPVSVSVVGEERVALGDKMGKVPRGDKTEKRIGLMAQPSKKPSKERAYETS